MLWLLIYPPKNKKEVNKMKKIIVTGYVDGRGKRVNDKKGKEQAKELIYDIIYKLFMDEFISKI